LYKPEILSATPPALSSTVGPRLSSKRHRASGVAFCADINVPAAAQAAIVINRCIIPMSDRERNRPVPHSD
jgi:hypothetical protein